MPDFEGEFIVPGSAIVPGQITVYPWERVRVLINKAVYQNVVEMSSIRSANLGSGKATITFEDVDKAIYGAVNEGDEVEIYLSEDVPMTSANKIWGGFVENPSYDLSGNINMKLNAKEYSQRLLESYTPNSAVSNQNSFVNVEPGTAIIALMANYQIDFTADSSTVLTGTSSLLTMDFLNKNLFTCLTEICDMFQYVWYVNLDKALVVKKIETVEATPATDYLTFAENIITVSEEKSKELLCNSVIVFGKTSGVVSNSGSATEDATSIATYGRAGKRITISSLSTNADCNNFANAWIAAYKNPVKMYKVKSYFLAHSEPLQYITADVPIFDLSGQLQIREIKHTYNANGIFTETTLGIKVSDLTMSLGQLMSRVNAVEIKAFA